MKVLLATLHSKPIHASLAIPCLYAFCQNLEGVEIVTREFSARDSFDDLLSDLQDIRPHVAAFSCYIWNIEKTLRLISEFKKSQPETFLILGGPEVSYDADRIIKDNPAVDCVVKGEGEGPFRSILEIMIQSAHEDGKRPDLSNVPGLCFRVGREVVDNPAAAHLSNLDLLPSPFLLGLVEYGKPLVYYESSRGCPFSCAFCLSALDKNVRSFSMKRIRQDLKTLMNSKTKQIKFVDRTFNYHAARANEIWSFILEQNPCSGFHFEIAADLLNDENIEMLKKVPSGVFRFEIGVQSITEQTLISVSRRSNMEKLFSNVRRLLEETRVRIHLDLVAGLPAEDYSGFLSSLERLFSLHPHHIQVEPLKILKGAPMMEIAKKEGYVFSDTPPYRINSTPWLEMEEINRIDTIGRLLELVYNSGRFQNALPVIEEDMSLSKFFDGLAQYWRDTKIETLPLEGLFDTLWGFAEKELSKRRLFFFSDALAYDRCLAFYPTIKKLPAYMKQDADRCRVSRHEIRTIRETLGIAPNTQVNALRYRFERDYGLGSGREYLFVYLSVTGKKLEVIIKDPKEVFRKKVNSKTRMGHAR